MNSIGLCQHNNVETYCPSCIRSKAMNRRAALSGGMGDCKAGFYDIGFGVCVPNLGTVATAAESAAAGSVASGAAGSPAVKQAGTTAAAGSVTSFIAKYPYQIAAGVALLVTLAGMGLVSGRRS
jgi:hypothetical protein